MILTLGQIKDRIRRKFLVTPLTDVYANPAAAGTPANAVFPSDSLLQQAVEEAIAYLNAFSRLGPVVTSNPYQIQGVPVTWRGPLYLDLDALLEAPGSIGEVIDSFWTDAQGNVYRLEPLLYRRLEETYETGRPFAVPFSDGKPQPAPRVYHQFASHIGLYPAPQQTGFLTIVRVDPLPYLVNNTDQLKIAGEWLPLLVNVAVRFICQVNPTNQENQLLAQAIEPSIQILTNRLIEYMRDRGKAFAEPFLGLRDANLQLQSSQRND